MQANGARLEFDQACWAQWHHVHAWAESGRMLVEPVNDQARVTLYDSWGRVLVCYRFRKGQWRHVDSGAPPEEFDERLAGRVAPAHALLPTPALALAAELYRQSRPIRTPIIPGDEALPREDSAIVQHLIRAAIAVFLAGWVVVWLGWVMYLVWKVWSRFHTGEWRILTLHDVGLHYHVAWPAAQVVIDYVLDLGLGWMFLLGGTAVYVVLGGTVLFFLFMIIKLVEALIRSFYTTA